MREVYVSNKLDLELDGFFLWSDSQELHYTIGTMLMHVQGSAVLQHILPHWPNWSSD